MHRTALAEEAAAKFLHDPIGLNQDSPKPVCVVAIVCFMRLVLIEPDRIGHFIWLFADIDVQTETVQLLHQAPIERHNRLRFQRKAARAAVAFANHQLMMNEIEVDLKGTKAVRNRRGGETGGGSIKSDVQE